MLVSNLSITGATLQPGNVPLLSSTNPIPINVIQLQADSAFLGSANVPAGTYDSLALTFANPQFTIFNGTGSAIGACANNAVCQLTPPTTPLTLTFSSKPFLLNVTANNPVALQVDIHVLKIIQPDLSVNLAAPNAVTLLPLPPNPNGQLTVGLGKVYGTVTSLSTNQFTLKTPWNQILTIHVNSDTYYAIPSNAYCDGPCNSTCNGIGQGFPCLLGGDVLRADVQVQPDGSVFAYQVDYLVGPGQEVYEGPIINLNTSGGSTTMNLILLNPATAFIGPSPSVYGIVTVPAAGVTYSVDSGSFTLPSVAGMGTFNGVGNLLVGQQVMVSPQGSVTSGPGSFGLPSLAFTAGSIALEPGYFPGIIASADASNSSFLISPQAQYFVQFLPDPPSLLNPINVSVYATSQTSYAGFSPENFSGLTLSSPVQVQGWLFPFTGANPACVPCAQTYGVVVAKAVQNEPNL
jgi:hypothetical protein